jgi:hypothetical protein
MFELLQVQAVGTAQQPSLLLYASLGAGLWHPWDAKRPLHASPGCSVTLPPTATATAESSNSALLVTLRPGDSQALR